MSNDQKRLSLSHLPLPPSARTTAKPSQRAKGCIPMTIVFRISTIKKKGIHAMLIYKISVKETVTAIYEVRAESEADALSNFQMHGEFLKYDCDSEIDTETAEIIGATA